MQKVDDARKNIKEKNEVAITKIRTVDVCTFESICHHDGEKKRFSSLGESKPEIECLHDADAFLDFPLSMLQETHFFLFR